MPVPKRYFHCSQEINTDPELWQFTTEFGDRSLRTWLQILSILDRSANQWRVSGDWLGTLSRMVRQSVANVSRQIRWLTEKEWLLIRETAADGSPLVFEARNWMKYNRTQEHKRNGTIPDSGTQRGLIDTPSFPTPTPTPSLSLPTPEDLKKDIGLVLVKPDAVLPNGSTRKVPSNRGSAYPEGFAFDERADGLAKSYGLNPHKELAAFRDHHVAKGSVFRDWQAAFRTWLRNAVKFAAKGGR